MRRKPIVCGCDQAVFPFSVATTTPSPAASQGEVVTPSTRKSDDALDCDDTALYLPLQAGERVRVLQREHQHSCNDTGTSNGDTLTQWCIAQREDGAVGLVPSSLLHRVPGHVFMLRGGNSVCTVGSTHHDPALGSAEACAFLAPENERGREEEEEMNTSTYNVGDDDAVLLQRRRRTSLRDRLQALHTPATPASAPTVVLDVVDAPLAGEEEDTMQLLPEVMRMSAEIDWLSRCVLPRLCAACDAAQLDVAAAEETSRMAEADAKEDDAFSAAEMRLAERREAVRALHAWLECRAVHDSDDDENNNNNNNDSGAEVGVVTPVSKDRSDTPGTALLPFAEVDTNRLGHPRSTPTAEPVCTSYRVDALRRLVQEECATMSAYRAQQRCLHERLTSLERLSAELAAEETALQTSETALHHILSARGDTDSCDEGLNVWPRTLPGLTEEEEAELRSSVAACDKYTHKLRGLDAALDHSAVCSTPYKTSALFATELVAGATPPLPCAALVDHLRQVLEEGDREFQQLQTKVKALLVFCETYAPAAREIDAQLQRGQRLLEERRSYLAQLP